MGQSLLLQLIAALQNHFCALIAGSCDRIEQSCSGVFKLVIWLCGLSALPVSPKDRLTRQRLCRETRNLLWRNDQNSTGITNWKHKRVWRQVAQPFLKLKNQAWKSLPSLCHLRANQASWSYIGQRDLGSQGADCWPKWEACHIDGGRCESRWTGSS